MKNIVFCSTLILGLLTAYGADDKIRIVLSPTTLHINEQIIQLNSLGSEPQTLKVKETVEYPVDSYYIELEDYPMAFRRNYNGPIHSLFIRFGREVDVQCGDIQIDNTSSVQDIEEILQEHRVEYTKYVRADGGVRVDSSLENHEIIQAAFENGKITVLELRLKKRPQPGNREVRETPAKN
jgi:hypothetical protein